MDAVKEDMQVVGVRVEDTENRLKWKTDLLWQPLKREKLEREKKVVCCLVCYIGFCFKKQSWCMYGIKLL